MIQFNILLIFISNAFNCSKDVQNLETKKKCYENLWMKQGDAHSLQYSFSNFYEENIEWPMLVIEQQFPYSNNIILDIILFSIDENYQICSLEENKETQFIRCNYQFLDYYVDNQLKIFNIESEFKLQNLRNLFCFQIIYFQKEILIVCKSTDKIEILELTKFITKFTFYFKDQANCKIEIKKQSENILLIFFIDCKKWCLIVLNNQIKIKNIIDISSVQQELGVAIIDQNESLLFAQLCKLSVYLSFSEKTLKLLIQDESKYYTIQLVKGQIYPFINILVISKCQEERFIQYTADVRQDNQIHVNIDCQTNIILKHSDKLFFLDERLSIINRTLKIELVQAGNFSQVYNYQLKHIFFFYDSRYLFAIDHQNQLLIFKIQPYQFYFRLYDNKSKIITQRNVKFCNIVKIKHFCINTLTEESDINKTSLDLHHAIQLFNTQSQLELQKSIITQNILPLNKCTFSQQKNNNILERFQDIRTIDSVCSFLENQQNLQLFNHYFILLLLESGTYVIYQGKNNSVIFFNCQTQKITQFQINAKLRMRMIESQSNGIVAIVYERKLYMFQVDKDNIQLTLSYTFNSNVLQFELKFNLALFLLSNSVEQLAFSSDGKTFNSKTIVLHTQVDTILYQNHYILQEQNWIDFRDGNFNLILRINLNLIIVKADFVRTNTDKILGKIIMIPKYENQILNYLYDGFDLIYLNDFSLLNYTLIKPIIYAERREYFAVAVQDTETQNKYIIIYNIRQTSLISIEIILSVKEYIFGFSSDAQFYYISTQGKIELFNLISIYMNFNIKNLKFVTISSQIILRCSSYLFPQLMKEVILNVDIQNYIHQLSLKHEQQNSIKIQDINSFYINFHHYLYGPINKVLLNKTEKFKLLNPITMTLLSDQLIMLLFFNNNQKKYDYLCLIYDNGLCIKQDNYLENFDNLNNNISYCIIPSYFLYQIMDVFVYQNYYIILVNMIPLQQINITLFDCRNSQIIQQLFEDFEPTEMALIKFKLEFGLLSIIKQYPTTTFCYFQIIVNDGLFIINKYYEFNDFAFIKNHPKQNKFIFLKYIQNQKFIFAIREFDSNLTDIQIYELQIQTLNLIQGEIIFFKIQSASFFNDYYKLEIQLNINNFFFIVVEILIHNSLNVSFQKIIRNPPLRGQHKLEQLNNNFYIVTVDNEQYLYDLTEQQEQFDYIYQMTNKCIYMVQYNSSHSICLIQQESNNIPIFFFQPHQYQIILSDYIDQQNQTLLSFIINNEVNQIVLNLEILQEPYSIEGQPLFLILYSLLLIFIMILIYSFKIFLRRRKLRKEQKKQII